MIKLASLNLVIRMLSFGRFAQWSLYSTRLMWRDHHLITITSLNRPQVLVVLSSWLIPMDTTFSSNTTPMALDWLLEKCATILFYSPSSLVITTICLSGPSRRSSTLVSVINWIHWTHGRRQFDLAKTRPTRDPQFQQKHELRQSSSTTLFLTLNSLAKLKVFKLMVRVI